MKTFKIIGMALLAIVISVIFAACSDDDERITKVSIAQGSQVDVFIGETSKLDLKYEPDYLQAPNCIWSSSNESCVAINELTGTYTAKEVGKAIITATCSELQMNAQCEINVCPIETKKISLNCTDKELLIDEEFVLTVKFEPEDATYKDVEWSSSNDDIAIVGENGEVLAVKDGKCVVTATTKDGKYKASCNITVNPIKVEKITLSCSEKSIEEEEELIIKATVTPQNATYKELIWTSSDSLIARVEAGKVIGVKEGNCIITATDITKTIKSECKINVKPISVKGIKLSNSNIKIMVGESIRLSYTINPNNAANQNVRWNITDNSKVKISQDGIITGLELGETLVKITTEDGNFSDTSIIKVCDIDEFISYGIGFTGGSVINGYAQGTFVITLENNSPKDLTMKGIRAYDGNTFFSIGYINLSGNYLKANTKDSFYVTLNRSIYKPILRITYIYNGREYNIDQQIFS